MLWALGLGEAASQAVPEIDPASPGIESGPVFTFDFHGIAEAADGFEVEVSPELAGEDSWHAAADAAIESVAEGVFRVSLPMGSDRLFCRVRVLRPASSGPRVLINEVMSDNVTAHADPAGDFWDWIELYNPGDEAVELHRYGLTDDPTAPAKWRFPARLIQPQGYQLVYASGLDRDDPAEPLHTNFKLKAAGETLILSDAALRPLDRIELPGLAPDESIGRAPDGGDELHFYDQTDSTPGSENPVVATGLALLSPRFAPEGGFFDGPVTVRIVGADSDHVIRYTLDGSVPDGRSPVLTSALTLTESTVVRTIAFDAQGRSSAPEARSYFIGVDHDLPVVSLAMAPENLEFRDGYLYGLGPSVLSSRDRVLKNFPYYGSNAWADREVEVAIEFFEPDRRLGFRQRAGVKMFGGWGSRGYPQKSFALFARRSYGAGKFDHRVFPDLDVREFEALVLRNSGNDNQSTHQTPPRPPITEFGPTRSYGSYFVNGTFTLMRDALMQRLIGEAGLDTQAYRPAVLYLNGEYWGLYNLREKMNEDYVISHHDLAPRSIDLIEGTGKVNAGSDAMYKQMRNYLASNNLAEDTYYDRVVEKYLELDNFIDYHLAVIYFQNFDIGNVKCWRPRSTRGRFRWLLYDQDYAFNLWPPSVYPPAMARDYADYDNMFRFYTAGTDPGVGWPNGASQTLLLRSLLDNARFKERFIRRCTDLLNSLFREDRVEQTIREMAAVIRPEIADHLHRWSWDELVRRGFGTPHQPEYQPFTQETWEANLNVLSAFGASRPAKLRQDCRNEFKLTGGLGTLRVRVQPEEAGRIQLNTLTIDSFPWEGVYFADIANTLRPIPSPGYRFVEWTTPSGAVPTHSIDYAVQGDTDTTDTLVARLEPAPVDAGGPAELIVTEIQYHPATGRDSGDWLELHNPGTNPVDLSGWIFRDEEDQHAFLLPSQILPPGDSLVLCQDDFRFRLHHPATVASTGSFRFSLGNGGDEVRLFRPNGTVALSIAYDDVLPWPEGADGTGFTLQLIDPQSDPSVPGSWRSSPEEDGTPGRW